MSFSTWQPLSHDDYETLKGFDVVTSDNEKLGTIKEILHPAMQTRMTGTPVAAGHYFRVDPGALKKLFSDQDEVFLSETLIRDVRPEEDTVILSIPRASVEKTDWSRPENIGSFRRS